MKNLKLKIALLSIFIFMFSVLSFIFVSREEIPFPNAKLFTEKSLFKSYEAPKFKLDLGLSSQKKTASLPVAFAGEEPKVIAEVFDDKNHKTFLSANVERTGEDTYSIVVPASTYFKPGKYTLGATIKTANGERNLTQDFSWGVLAINTNKSIYSPNEQAKLAISVLNEGGFNVCDAEVELKIAPTNRGSTPKITTLTTKDGTIKRAEHCFGAEITYLPDYFATYQTNASGQYNMTLTTRTKNGVFQIKDYFEVRKNVDFDVERITATKINPVSPCEANRG